MLFNSTNPRHLNSATIIFNMKMHIKKKLYLNKEGVAVPMLVLPKGVAGKMDKSKLQISM